MNEPTTSQPVDGRPTNSQHSGTNSTVSVDLGNLARVLQEVSSDAGRLNAAMEYLADAIDHMPREEAMRAVERLVSDHTGVRVAFKPQ